MDEIHDQLNFINFTALTTRITESEDTRRVAQLTQTDEFEEDGELEELTDRLGKRAQFEVGQTQLPRTAFPGLLDAAEGLFFKRPFEMPLWHTRRSVNITGAYPLCRFSNALPSPYRTRELSKFRMTSVSSRPYVQRS